MRCRNHPAGVLYFRGSAGTVQISPQALLRLKRSHLPALLPTSGEAREDEIALSEAELAGIFEQYPLILENTKRLLDDCGISFEFGTNKNKKSFSGSIASDVEMIRRECEKGRSEERRVGKECRS